jgi:CubicO group peptidase (beta-lactamase class C family)
MFRKKIVSATASASNVATGKISGVADKAADIVNKVVSKIPGVDHITIPDDLSEVTHIGAEVSADLPGLQDNSVQKIWASAESFYRSQLHNQITLCVRREGKIILNRSIGIAKGQYGDETAIAGSVDTPFCLFSASKAVSALLLCKFDELEELSLSDTISRYIPEFGKHGKKNITLGELISHRAKVPSVQFETPAQLTDHDFVLDHLCDSRPNDAKQAYHAITGGFIIAEVIERITDKPIAEALDTYFRQPMSMKYFTYGLERKYRDLSSESHVSGIPLIGPLKQVPVDVLGMSADEVVNFSNTNAFMDAVLPSGNMFATADECSRFYQMLLDDGVYNGHQVLHPDTIREARGGGFLPRWDDTFNLPAHFSRGGFMLNTPPMMLFGLNAPRAFGHLGFINILSWADLQRGISVGLLTSGKPFLGPHLYNFANIPSTINRYCPKL